MYPGQLPPVRRDIHNVIIPVDFTSSEHVSNILDTILNLIQRGIPLRWGIVPQTPTTGALDQAKVIYHLKDSYGLPAVIKYLSTVSQFYDIDRPETDVACTVNEREQAFHSRQDYL